jgi:hypothetical protein
MTQQDILIVNAYHKRITLELLSEYDLKRILLSSRQKTAAICEYSNSVDSANVSPSQSRPASPSQRMLSHLNPSSVSRPQYNHDSIVHDMYDWVWAPPWGHPDDRIKWRLLHLGLCHLIGTNRPDFAIDILTVLLNRHPDFSPASFCLICALLYSWSGIGSGGARFVREDYLEEAFGLLQRLKLLQSAQNKRMGNNSSTNLILDNDLLKCEIPGTRESNFLFFIEKTYFWNGFRAAGINTRTLSLMASFVMAKQFMTLGMSVSFEDSVNSAERSDVSRVHQLLGRARDRGAFREAESISLRLIMFENLYENPHESLLKSRIAFRDLLEDSHDAEVEERGAKHHPAISVDVECFRCGEMLLVTGTLHRPFKKTNSVEERNTDNSTSLPSQLSSFRDINKQKWTEADSRSERDMSLIPLRPLILLPAEASRVYEVAVQYFTKASSLPELTIRNKPKWKLVAEYTLQVLMSSVSLHMGIYLI